MKHTLYKMGLIETLCFTQTDKNDSYYMKNDMLFHIRGPVSKVCRTLAEFLWNS